MSQLTSAGANGPSTAPWDGIERVRMCANHVCGTENSSGRNGCHGGQLRHVTLSKKIGLVFTDSCCSRGSRSATVQSVRSSAKKGADGGILAIMLMLRRWAGDLLSR